MTRYNPIELHEVDWDGDGNFNNAYSDISQYNLKARVSYGTSRINLERPTVHSASGSVEVTSRVFDPNKVQGLTPNQIRRRSRYRIKSIIGSNETILFDGYILGSKVTDVEKSIVRFSIQGRLEQPTREEVMISQPQSSTNANAASTLLLLRNAYGLDYDIDTRMQSTPLSIYSFSGRAGSYLSRFSRIAGVFPIETANGRLELRDPTLAAPTTAITLANSQFIVSDVQSEYADNHLRNYANVEYIFRTGANRQTATGDGSANWRTPIGVGTATITLPPLPTGQSYGNFEFSGATVRNISGIAFRLGIDGTDRVVPLNSTTATFSGEVTGTSTDNDGNTVVSLAVTVTNPSGVGRVGGSPFINFSSWYTGFHRTTGQVSGWIGQIEYVQYTANVTYDVITPDQDITLQASNTESINTFGQISIAYDNWFASNAVASVQSRIDAIAQPRNFHTVTLPLWQRNSTNATLVSQIDSGDYLNLDIADTFNRIAINQSVLVTRVTLEFDPTKSARKILTCLETGHSIVATPNYMYWSNSNNPLSFGNAANRLVWQ